MIASCRRFLATLPPKTNSPQRRTGTQRGEKARIRSDPILSSSLRPSASLRCSFFLLPFATRPPRTPPRAWLLDPPRQTHRRDAEDAEKRKARIRSDPILSSSQRPSASLRCSFFLADEGGSLL